MREWIAAWCRVGLAWALARLNRDGRCPRLRRMARRLAERAAK